MFTDKVRGQVANMMGHLAHKKACFSPVGAGFFNRLYIILKTQDILGHIYHIEPNLKGAH